MLINEQVSSNISNHLTTICAGRTFWRQHMKSVAFTKLHFFKTDGSILEIEIQ